MVKQCFLLIGVSLCAIAAAGVETDKFDAGGVSVDLAKCQVEQVAPQGENMLKFSDFEDAGTDLQKKPFANWGSSFYVHQKDSEEIKSKIMPLTARKISTDNPASGARCAALITPLSVNQYRDAKGTTMISNRITQNIVLPETAGQTKYLLTFKLRGRLENTPGLNSFRGFVSFFDNPEQWKAKQLKEMLNVGFTVKSDWQDNSLSFIAPAGTRSLNISLALYGCGEVYLDDVKLQPVQMEKGMTVKLMPFAFLDNIFCLGTGQPGTLVFAFGNENATKVEHPVLYLKIPEAFKLVDVRNILKITGQKRDDNGNVTCEIDFSPLKSSISKDFYGVYQVASAMLKTDLPPGEKLYPAEYWVEDGSYRSAPEKFNLKIIPPSSGKTPQIFRSATMLVRESDFAENGTKEFVPFYVNNGFNCVHGVNSQPMLDAFKKAGISRYSQPHNLCNGYRLGDAKKTDEAFFRLVDGSPYNKPEEAICPVEVYKQGPYYKEHVIGMLEKILVGKDTADNIMPNWEPYMFDFKGCFCPRCKEEFIQHSRLPREDVDKKWPNSIIASYKEQWIKFRSWQHAMMLQTLEQTINDLGKKAGKNAHFMPEVGWSYFIENSNHEGGQYNPADYLDKLPWIEIWGPYIFQPFTKPYEYYTGIHLITYMGARDMKKFVADRVPDQTRRPKLIAFPHGLQCNDWVTEPEALGFEYLCFFLNGWEGAFAYLFPRGYDQRYWGELARTNNTIAGYENYVFKGRRDNSINTAIVSPVPAASFPKSWSEGGNFLQKLPGLANASLLQSVSYELDNRRMIAAGNFWLKGEIFFKLKVGSPGKSMKYVLTQPDRKRCFANAAGDIALSSDDLEKGILLHTGALRWNFYILEPYEAGKNYGEVITPAEMDKVLKARLPAIEKAVQWEKQFSAGKLEQAARELGLPDYSGIKDMSNAGVSCQKKIIADKTVVEFKAGDMTLTLDPAVGGRLMSWTRGRDELVSQDEKTGLAVDAFWWPSDAISAISTPYKVVSQSKTGSGLGITLERELTAADNRYLTGVVIRKTYDISASGFKLNSEVINQTKKTLAFAFRWHNMPGLFEIKNGAGGQAAMENDGKPEIFPRLFICKLYRFAAQPDKDLEGAFRMEQAARITSPKTTFSAPWSPVKVTAEITSAKDLHCLIFWDSGKQKASTFEPVSVKIKLDPGQSWAMSCDWSCTAGQ